MELNENVVNQQEEKLVEKVEVQKTETKQNPVHLRKNRNKERHVNKEEDHVAIIVTNSLKE